MSVTLDATLKSALDGLNHHPICKIVSTSLASDIPFDGQLFNSQTADETDPDMLVHSTGRLASTFVRSGDLYLMYSDEARTTWYEVRIFDNAGISGFSVINASLIELSNANIGVVFLARSATYDRLYSMIIGPIGTVVSAASQIVQETLTSVSLGALSLCETATGFLLAYKYRDVAASPDNYYLYKRTCNTSFASWSSASSITLTGLISTRDKDHPELFRNQAGAIYLFFDYLDDYVDPNERRNIFYVISSDEGATWTIPAALTSYGDFSASAVSPSVSEKTNGDIVIAYHAQISVLKIGSSTTGYCTSSGETTDNHITDIFYIASSNKVYIVGGAAATNTDALLRVLVIDVATWTIEKCYKQDGSPGWNARWSSDGMNYTQQATAAGDYLAIISKSRDIILINTQTDTIVEYHLQSSALYGYTKNVSGFTLGVYHDYCQIYLDATTDRLYLFFHGEYATAEKYQLCWIDITETADPITGLYTIHELIAPTYYPTGGSIAYDHDATIHFNLTEDKVVFSVRGWTAGAKGFVRVHVLSTGSLYKTYIIDTNVGFPRRGIMWTVLHNDMLYGNVEYESGYGQEERRGLCLINMSSDTITFERPTVATVNDYGLADLRVVDSGINILMASYYGVLFYSIVDKTWNVFNNDNVQGMFTDAEDFVPRLAYNESTGMVFTSHCYLQSYPYDKNFIAFVTTGNMSLGKYIPATLSGGSYSFGTESDLHLYRGGENLTIAYDANNVLWNIWTQVDTSLEKSLMWDRDNFNPDISDYILAGSAVTLNWEVGKTAKASFTLSRADLFDVSNSMSIYAPIFKKGRIVEVSLGETIGGVDYWQAQGQFVVCATRVDYRRTAHPVIEIESEDRSVMWSEMMVTATTGYRNAALSDIMDDILQDIAGLTVADYSIPSLTNGHTLYIQWIDTDLAAIIEDICQHFGVFAHWQVDGTWTLVPIDLDAAVAHDYTTAQSKILNFGPDDRYSSFINQIRVICEGQDFLEVLWDEERITQLSGVVGFWTKQETHTVYYSDDRARTVRYPRLDIIQSINDFSPLISLLGGQGDEYIQSTAEDETYCIVKIEAPNRAIYAFAFAAAIAGFGAAALYCEVRFYCGVSIMLTNLALSAFIQVVTAVANFKYDIWGQPIGHEKQTYQATADDTELQQQLGGQVVSQHFNDALSYTVAHCQMVADQEIAVVSAQRNRITFDKVAHLQDEIGDIIKISHPISSQAVDVFVAKLKRSFVRPPIGGQGQFSDGIEGWRL